MIHLGNNDIYLVNEFTTLIIMTNRYIPIECKEFPGWFEIPGFAGYCANKNGHILNKKTKNFSVGGNAGRYLKVSAYKDGNTSPSLYYVHDLVARAFHGLPLTDKMVVLHRDNVRGNNKPNNLRWGTQSENIIQVYKDGLKYSKKHSVSNETYTTLIQWANNGISISQEEFEYVSVNSSNINNVGFDPKTRVMVVEFKNGSTYQYAGLTKKIFMELVHADSVGKYFHNNVRMNYTYSKLH